MSPGHIILHIGGASTFTAAFIVSLLFVSIFALSFAFGRAPESVGRLSWFWLRSWLAASAPRLAVAAVFSASVFFASAQFGGSEADNLCRRPVPPLSQNAVTAESLAQAISGLRELSTVRGGDTFIAESLFLGDTHNLTHDIDAVLRPVDPDLARDLCRSVVIVENEFAGQRRLGIIADEATTIADLLSEAADELELTS
jgi:hypothetical protein